MRGIVDISPTPHYPSPTQTSPCLRVNGERLTYLTRYQCKYRVDGSWCTQKRCRFYPCNTENRSHWPNRCWCVGVPKIISKFVQSKGKQARIVFARLQISSYSICTIFKPHAHILTGGVDGPTALEDASRLLPSLCRPPGLVGLSTTFYDQKIISTHARPLRDTPVCPLESMYKKLYI